MEIQRQSGSLRVGHALYTASVLVRHNPKCPDADKGGDWTKCDCRKSILVYNGATKKQDRISAHTRSWAQATIQAEEWLDQFDPFKIERKKEEAQAVTVEKAVAAFIADKRFQKLSAKTIDRNRALLGDGTPEGAEGKLMPWLAQQNPPVRFVSEITSTHLLAWRSTWEMGDLTAYMAWGTIKEFFRFCVAHEWIIKDPAENIKRPTIEKGNRTAIFTDKQYDAILKKASKDEKLKTFVLLLRWSAMSLTDATQFTTASVDNEGVLRYKREKTDILATVQLPKDVVAHLHRVSQNEEQPFRRTDIKLESNIHEWRRTLQKLFTQAGITTVTTEVGERKPHPSMFRDTCIVYYLRQGMSLHNAAKILGHNNTLTIQKHYLPYVKELEKAVIDETRAILARSV